MDWLEITKKAALLTVLITLAEQVFYWRIEYILPYAFYNVILFGYHVIDFIQLEALNAFVYLFIS